MRAECVGQWHGGGEPVRVRSSDTVFVFPLGRVPPVRTPAFAMPYDELAAEDADVDRPGSPAIARSGWTVGGVLCDWAVGRVSCDWVGLYGLENAVLGRGWMDVTQDWGEKTPTRVLDGGRSA